MIEALPKGGDREAIESAARKMIGLSEDAKVKEGVPRGGQGEE